MQRSQVIPTIYGYLVCLIAIFLFIASIAGLVSNVFRIADPLIGGMRGGPGMRMAAPGFGPPPFVAGAIVYRGRGVAPMAPPPNPRFFRGGERGGTQVFRTEIDRDAMIGHSRLAAVRSFVVDLVLIAVAVLLFGWHWRWLNEPQPA